MRDAIPSANPHRKRSGACYHRAMDTTRHPPAEPTVTFWGAARTVTGSMHQLTVQRADRSCSTAASSRAAGPRADGATATSPSARRTIDAVVLSHAHIDHCGNLPNLVRQGFTGPIYCTPATRALAAVMLGDAAKIQEEDAAYLNRKRDRRRAEGRAALRRPRRLPHAAAAPGGAVRQAVRGRPRRWRRRSSTPATCSARR